MKLPEIRGKDSRELQLNLQELDKELFNLRFRSASEQISNPSRFRAIRRTMARIRTVLRQRELTAQAGS